LDLSPDWRVFAFTLFIAAVTGAVAGLAPAIQMSRPDVIAVLKDETSQRYLSKSRLRSGLVVGQIAVSLSLLIGAGLLAFNARRLQHVDTGMNTHDVFSVTVGLSDGNTGIEETKLRQDLSDRLRALPDVTSVSEAFNQPLSGNMGNRLLMVQGDQQREGRFNLVSAEYFQTLSIRILKGRPFSS
jgi:hypothetical protein